jgi:hypothetical protein
MIHRCVNNCTAQNAPWSANVQGGWGSDTQSFILPYDLSMAVFLAATTVRRPVFPAAAVI